MRIILKYIIPPLILIIFIFLIINDKVQFDSSDYLTFGLTILTYFYVVFTWEMLEKIKTESYLERRPYIIADFESPKSELSFFVQNIGKTPAKDVVIKINPDFKIINADSINNSMFKDKIEFYPPNKRVETFIASTSEFFKNNPNKYVVTLTYKDSFNNSFNEKITLDLNHHKKQSYVIEKDIKDLIKSIDDLKKVIEKK
jgi:hypothetical protein